MRRGTNFRRFLIRGRESLIRAIKWLYPGMQVKRWILLCAAGISLVGLGSVKALSREGTSVVIWGALLMFIGVVWVVIGMRSMVKTFITILLPQREKELVNIVFRKRHLEKGPKIAVIGGGTGLSVLLRGLKDYTSNMTAIVAVADDGGSSGRLRQEFDVIPPGDLRNCLVALADAEPLMRDLFQYRFSKGSGLDGHNFGNLFITALSEVTGDFERAIKESSRVLAIRGKVIPSTLSKVRLEAEYDDGSTSFGESNITATTTRGPIKRIWLNPAHCRASTEAIEAIAEAEAIVLGPGSLYTSIVPNLLLKDIRDAVNRSLALKIYACNVMTQFGETGQYTAADHVNVLLTHGGLAKVDYCIVNTAEIPASILERYKQEQAYPVLMNSDAIRRLNCEVIEEEVISTLNYVRHDPEKLAKIIVDTILDARYG